MPLTKQKRIKPVVRLSKPHLAIYLLTFALIGGLILLVSHASPNSSLPGYLDGNNKVDSADLAIMIVNYGTTFSGADITGDGMVNGADFSTLLSHMGESVSGSLTTGPSTVSHNIDGNLNESDWNISNQAAKCVIGTCNNTVSFGSLWDANYLYVGVKVLDSSLRNDSANCWDDDSAEVYIDPTNAGGTTYTANDRQIVQRYNDAGLCSGVGSNNGVLHAWAPISGGYSVELAIPWSLLGTTASSGKTIGLDIGVNDDDDSTTRDSQMMWSGTANNSVDPSGFGHATLSGTPTGGAPSGGGGGTSPPPSGQLYGYSAHILRQSDQSTYVSLLANSGAKTERDDWDWDNFEPSNNTWDWSSTDKLMTYLAQNNIHADILLGTTPSWASGVSSGSNWWWHPPINNADFGDAAGHLAARYGANGSFWTANPSLPKVLPAGIEIWNEPNLSGFWGVIPPDPVKYTGMLKAAYTAIKAADPTMTVISAGIAPAGGYNDVDCNGTADGGSNSSKMNGINFLQAMYQNGAAGYMDAVGYHPYNWGSGTAASYLAYHICSAWSQVNDTPISVRSLMTQYGDGSKKVWATEIGAPTDTGHFSESEQASLATQLVTKWKADSRAGNFYWYDLRDDGTDTTYTEDNFGTVHTNNVLKPAYTALKTAW
jgi:hypothetical protein